MSKELLVSNYLEKKSSGEFDLFFEHGVLDEHDFAGYYLSKYDQDSLIKFEEECKNFNLRFYDTVRELLNNAINES